MIEAKDIAVSVSCLFPDTKPIWMMEHTCKRFNIPLHPYGIGEIYKGWVDIKINRLQKVAEDLSATHSHILYSDARDAFFLAPLEEVAEKYNALGAPPLMLSAQPDIFGTYAEWYKELPWDLKKRFPYIGTPGILAETKALSDALKWMQKRRDSGDWGEMHDDDPPWWCNFIRERPGELILEHDCSIFMNCGSYIDCGMWGPTGALEIKNGRVWNRLTQQWPCILHFNGGSSHWLHGKWEWLEPYWRELGYTASPPWEDK